MTRVDASSGRATLRDVAELAGVSLATASKALNGRGEVAASTRRRVKDAAERLAFTPNQLAQSLLAGRTRTVGLLTSDLDGRFVLPILMGAEDAFGAGQVNVFLCDARGDAIREQHHLRALLTRRVDGIIVVAASTNPRPSLGRDIPVPVVYAYGASADPSDVSVVPDNVGGGRMAADHLLTTGRRRIAHISGDPTYTAAQDRAIGVRAALDAAGVDMVGDVMYSNWSEHWGRDATALLLAQHPEVDGIVCASDQIARGALDTLRDLGKRVPEDVAVIGYDNWEVLATNSRPELTSVDPNLQQLGRFAAMQIFDAIDAGPADGGVHPMPVRLLIRGSTIPRR
jgi:LacI family transcriptional regulator